MNIRVRKKNILDFFEELKNTALRSNDIEFSMTVGNAFGHLLQTNQVGIYRDDSFEAALIPKAMQAIPVNKGLAEDRILHVISTPYKTGGHTRLMERLQRLHPNVSDVLVTRPYVNDARSLRLAEGATVHHSSRGFELKDLVRISSKYKTICLHIHPNDLQAAVAIGVVKKLKSSRIIFVNHADHVFSFGFYSADVVAEVSSFGFALSQKHRAVNSSFLGIPLDRCDFPKTTTRSNSVVHLYSAAESGKYKPFNGLSFPYIAEAILEAIPNCVITVIGPTLRDIWWLRVKLRFPSRLSLRPCLIYDHYMELMRKADIYLDSFPIAGGTALPEVREQGILVTGMVTGAMGYTPFDKTKFNSIEELVEDIHRYATEGDSRIVEINNSMELLDEARKVHCLNEVNVRFTEIITQGKLFHSHISISEHDLSFYEKQWQKRGVLIIKPEVLGIVLSQIKAGRHNLFRTLFCAIGMSGLLCLVVKYFRCLRSRMLF